MEEMLLIVIVEVVSIRSDKFQNHCVLVLKSLDFLLISSWISMRFHEFRSDYYKDNNYYRLSLDMGFYDCHCAIYSFLLLHISMFIYSSLMFWNVIQLCHLNLNRQFTMHVPRYLYIFFLLTCLSSGASLVAFPSPIL